MNPLPGLTPFVGESRHLLLDGLVQLYDDVRQTGMSRWVSLEAPSGWGKTRVGRELYARLAASQTEPAYWPGAIADTRRKATFPELVPRDRGSVPEFLWWGIACSTRDDLPTNALIADLRQIEVHAPYVEVAWKRLEPGWKRHQDQIAHVGRIVLKEGGSVAAAAAAELVGVSTGLGLVVRLARWTKGQVQERREKERLISDSEILRIEPSLDIVEDTVEVLSRASRPGFPIVLLIEDLHKADGVLLKFIDALLTRASHLLVVSTTLPDVLEQHAKLADLVEHHSRRLHRVGYLQPADDPFPAGAGLTALEPAARAEILRYHFPEIAPSTENALLARYASPHDLEIVCRLPKHRKNHPVLRLDLDAISRLPSGIKQLYEEYWDQLPRPMRMGLAVAAVITPVSINAIDSGDLRSWDHRLLLEVLSSVEFPMTTTDEIVTGLEVTPNAYAWVHVIDDCLRSFSDDTQLVIASEKGLEMLDEELDNPRNVILDELASWWLQSPPRSTSTIHEARTVLALRGEGFLDEDDIAAGATLTILADLADPPREVQERIRLFEHFCELDPRGFGADTAQAIRSRGADALGEAGRVEEAITAYRDLLTELRLAFPGEHSDTLAAQVRLAGLLGEAGGVDEAVACLRRLLDEFWRVLGHDNPDTLVVHSNLAHWLGEAGCVEEAITTYRELANYERSVLGDDHPYTLTTRGNLARWLAEAGHVEEATSVGRGVLADRLDTLGDDHPDTLTTRGNLAMALGQSGRAPEAITDYEELLVDMGRVLGDDHPTTLTTRGSLAACLNEAGRVDEAIAVYQDLLEDQRRILGDDHPDTLVTRSNLTGLPSGTAESAQTMIATCRELLSDELRVLGDDHPLTLATRGNLTDGLGRAGRVAEAIAGYEELLVDLQRVLGEDHPTVLVARGSLAHWHGEAGYVDKAIAAYQELLTHQRRVLGDDHYDTRATLGNLAGLLAQIGQLSEAIAAYRELLTVQRRVLSEDHPDTLAILGSHAYWLGQAGRFEEAIAAYRELLTVQRRVLGEDHLDTLATRNNLAAALGQGGRVSEAMAIYEDLVGDLRLILGDDHPTTLTSRGNLAGLIGSTGRVQEAITIYYGLLDELERVLGDDHPTTLMTRRNLEHYLAMGESH